MKIQLLADYRGVLTGEEFYKAGQHDLPDELALALVNAGRAEPLQDVSVTVDFSQMADDELRDYARGQNVPVRSNWKRETILKKLADGS